MFSDLTFDPNRYALLKQEHSGHCMPSDLPGLADYLHGQHGGIDYKVKGFINDNGLPVIEVSVTGEIELTCQRCLEAMMTPVSSSTMLVLMKDESHLPEVDEEVPGVDMIVAPPEMNVLNLVEEEILLSLPITVLHDSDQCQRSESLSTVKKEDNPFLVLKKLKG